MNSQDTSIVVPDFNFWFPAEIEKAGGNVSDDLEKIDKDNMFLKGIASDESWDADNQSLKSEGLELDYLMSRGFVNWHHQSKEIPSAIIGEPVEAKILTNPKPALFIKAKLYNTQTAVDAYKLARILEKQSATRRLGWSIEGKILERNGNIINKAKLTGVALTPSPKNANTFADVCKAFYSEQATEKLLSQSQFNGSKIIIETLGGIFDISKNGELRFVEKALTADGSGSVLKREDLEGSQINYNNMNKVLKQILLKYPDITFEKALKIAKKVIDNKLN